MINNNIQNHPKLKGYNDEIEKCLSNELYSQVTSTCRQALEYMVNQYVIEYNQSLNLCKTVNEKINGLKSSGIVSEEWVKNSTVIRRVANDGGAHDNTSSSGHVINKNEANKVYQTLIKLENDFLEKMPLVSTKELQDGFKNKRFERDELLDKLDNNEYIFNVSSHDSKDGNTWYFFNFKVKILARDLSFIKPENVSTKQIGKDNGYYIYEFNDIKENAKSWALHYLDKLNRFNAMSDEEITEYDKELIRQEDEKRSYEAKLILQKLNENKYIYDASFNTDINNNLVYSLKFKIKKIVQDNGILALYTGMHKLEEDEDYYIYDLKADKRKINNFIVSYYEQIIKYNEMSSDEIAKLVNEIEEIKKKNEEEEKTRKEKIKKEKEERLKKYNRNKIKRIIIRISIIAIIVLGVIFRGKISSTINSISSIFESTRNDILYDEIDILSKYIDNVSFSGLNGMGEATLNIESKDSYDYGDFILSIDNNYISIIKDNDLANGCEIILNKTNDLSNGDEIYIAIDQSLVKTLHDFGYNIKETSIVVNGLTESLVTQYTDKSEVYDAISNYVKSIDEKNTTEDLIWDTNIYKIYYVKAKKDAITNFKEGIVVYAYSKKHITYSTKWTQYFTNKIVIQNPYIFDGVINGDIYIDDLSNYDDKANYGSMDDNVVTLENGYDLYLVYKQE